MQRTCNSHKHKKLLGRFFGRAIFCFLPYFLRLFPFFPQRAAVFSATFIWCELGVFAFELLFGRDGDWNLFSRSNLTDWKGHKKMLNEAQKLRHQILSQPLCSKTLTIPVLEKSEFLVMFKGRTSMKRYWWAVVIRSKFPSDAVFVRCIVRGTIEKVTLQCVHTYKLFKCW